MRWTRSLFLPIAAMLRAGSIVALGLTPVVALAAEAIVVHRDPGCGCCAKWAAILRQQLGREVRILDNKARATLQTRAGVPVELRSCHTVVVDGLVFEGHVPIADMKRLLTTRPMGVRGLAVAGMPIGSPGMEMPGGRAERFEVIAFGAGIRRVFARYG